MRWILQEMDEGTIEGVMDGCKRLISEQLKDLWIMQAIDQGAMEVAKDATRDESMEGVMDATSDGSGNN